MAGQSRRWLAAVVLLLAVAVAGVGQLPRSALAQAPPEWDSNGEVTLTNPTSSTMRNVAWSEGVRLSLYNNSLTVYAVDINTSYDQVYLYFSLDRDFNLASISAVFSLIGRVQLLSSGGQTIFTSENFAITNTSTDTTFSALPSYRALANVRSNSSRSAANGSVRIMAEEPSSGGAPTSPARVSTSRSADNSTATLSWELFDPVSEYEIEQEQAITIEAMTTATTQYGNTTRFTVAGTIAGVDEYIDSTVQPGFTYRYRVRAKGGNSGGPAGDGWSDFSPWNVSGGQSTSDTKSPGGIQAIRADDNSQVVLSWTAPEGEFTGFAVQRQELVLAEGSTIFANPVILADDLPADATTYTDATIAPGRTYEYRVSPLEGGVFGQASEWARVPPVNTSWGGAPQNLRFDDSSDRYLADRREFWLRWDDVDRVDDYQVQTRVYDGNGDRTMSSYIYTDPSFFGTGYGRVEVRVRGRGSNDDLCGTGTNDYCYTEWTPWYGVGFSATVEQARRPAPEPDPSIQELQDDVNELINSTLDQSGADVDPSIVVQFAVLVGAASLAMVSVVAGFKRGMRPLGVGMAFSVIVISLYLGTELLGIPLAWAIGAQSLVAIPGVIAVARQAGAFR